MKGFSVLAAIYSSFFARELYVDVARRWRVRAFVYLLLLLTICWIPYFVRARSSWSGFLQNDLPGLVEQIPPITISQGRVTADVAQPHFIWDPTTQELIAVIDTTGSETSLDDTSARFLLTDQQLFVRKTGSETRAYDLAHIDEFHVDGPLVDKWARILGAWGLVLLFPLLVLCSYAYRLVQALFYSLFGLIFAKSLPVRLSYGAILRVTLVALTPSVVVKTILETLGISFFPLTWLVLFLIAIAYLRYGMAVNRDAAEPDLAS